MIEVLVAVVILAIGLLASSRMQILGINYTVGATTRTQATMAANDIIDRMRLNRAGVTAGAYDPANLANTDLAEWTSSYFGTAGGRTSTQLPPGAQGVISAADAQNVRTVTITWNDLIDGIEAPQFVAVQVIL